MTITILGHFGSKRILRYNPHLPKPKKLRATLLSNKVQKDIVERIIVLAYQQEKEVITVRLAHPRSKNGDLLIYY